MNNVIVLKLNQYCQGNLFSIDQLILKMGHVFMLLPMTCGNMDRKLILFIPMHCSVSSPQCYTNDKLEKKHKKKVCEVEHGTFSTLVFSVWP